MQLIDRLTSDPKQKYTLVGKNGEQIGFLLYFLPTQNCWAFDISYGDFAATSLILRSAPNILRSWRNIIPFGLAVVTTDGLEPYFKTDFITNRVKLWLLDADEVAQMETDLFK